jgi:hypothetical protein
MKKDITKTDNGVKIKFSGEVKKSNIVMIVENCSTGKCGCMKEETKAKIKNMSVEGKDGNVELSLDGELSVEEIKEAISKSKLLDKE